MFRVAPLGFAMMVVGASLIVFLPGQGLPAEGENSTSKPVPGAPWAAEVQFTNGSVLKLKILDERLSLKTPYGKLVIPFSDINEIECATRVPDEVAKHIGASIQDLGSSEFKKRDAATAQLAKLGEKAYPALVLAEKDKDAEVQRRARALLDKLRKAVADENLEIRDHDVIHTSLSKIAGRIEEFLFRAETPQFGEVRLKISDVRTIRSLSFRKEDKAEDSSALPNPGTLVAYHQQIGKTFTFNVTGAVVGGAVWGTDQYTLDSALAIAAVHAGVLKPGKAGKVKVKILPPIGAFVGSARNGVNTEHFGPYPGGFEFVKK